MLLRRLRDLFRRDGVEALDERRQPVVGRPCRSMKANWPIRPPRVAFDITKMPLR